MSSSNSLPVGRSRLVWWGTVVLIVAVSVAAFASNEYTWVGWLPTTFSVFHQIDLWSAPLSCALGAWLSGQARRHGFLDWQRTSARPVLEQWWAVVKFGSGAIIVAHAVVFDGLLAASIFRGADLRSEAWVTSMSLLVTIASSVVWLCVGLVLGRWMPVLLAILLSMVLPYSVMIGNLFLFSDSWLSTLTVFSGRIYIDLLPDAASQVIRLVFWVGLALWCAGKLAGRRRVRALGRVAALAMIPVALLSGAPSAQPIANSHDPVCQGAQPTVCVDRAHRTVLNEYQQEARSVTVELPARLRPDVLHASDLTVDLPGRSMQVGPVNSQWSTAFRVQHSAFVASVGNAAFLTPCRNDPASVTGGVMGSTPPDMLNIWWRLNHGLPIDAPAYSGDGGYVLGGGYDRAITGAKDLQKLSPSQRDVWFDAHLVDALNCVWPR